MSALDRRNFLKDAAIGSGLLLAGPLQALLTRQGSIAHAADGYGPIAPVADQTTGLQLLALPPGFQYWSFGEVGSIMSDGRPTPPAHDGMAAFRDSGRIRLVRNHEVRGAGPAFGPVAKAYNPSAPGGTTTLIFDPRHPGAVISFASLSGTSTNCAGGATPWRSWLTCEETTTPLGLAHGYVFEVPSKANAAVAAIALKAMGRFAHEALALDPRTNYVYETEDSGSSGLYRFIPARGHDFRAGRLQMLAIEGWPQYDARSGQVVGTELPVAWVDIDDADPGAGVPSVFSQGFAKGGAFFRRLEGAWYSDHDNVIYFNSTDGGNASAGQVWAYRPEYRKGGTLTLVYESPSTDVLLKPDNITVSAGGGILLCEDTDRARQTFLRGITPDGTLYTFAANIRAGLIPGSSTPASWDEFAGATFDPDGEWLFVNIQTPGITFAITGPFEAGPLGHK